MRPCAIACVIAMLIAFVPMTSTSGPVGPKGDDFFDDFLIGNMAGWTVVTNEGVIGNAAISTAQVYSPSYAVKMWRDSWPLTTALERDGFIAMGGRYEAWFYVDGPVADGFLFFQMIDQNNRYEVLCRPNGTDNPEVRLVRRVGGNNIHLAAVPATFGLREWFKVTVDRWPDGDIDIFINDHLQIHVKDLGIVIAGKFCVGSWQNAYVDDVMFRNAPVPVEHSTWGGVKALYQ